MSGSPRWKSLAVSSPVGATTKRPTPCCSTDLVGATASRACGNMIIILCSIIFRTARANICENHKTEDQGCQPSLIQYWSPFDERVKGKNLIEQGSNHGSKPICLFCLCLCFLATSLFILRINRRYKQYLDCIVKHNRPFPQQTVWLIAGKAQVQLITMTMGHLH